jgi:hypothetical protein
LRKKNRNGLFFCAAEVSSEVVVVGGEVAFVAEKEESVVLRGVGQIGHGVVSGQERVEVSAGVGQIGQEEVVCSGSVGQSAVVSSGRVRQASVVSSGQERVVVSAGVGHASVVV